MKKMKRKSPTAATLRNYFTSTTKIQEPNEDEPYSEQQQHPHLPVQKSPPKKKPKPIPMNKHMLA